MFGNDFVPLFAIFAIFIAPLWIIFHYVSKAKQHGKLTGEDEKMLEDVWQLANRMESRINALETILDARAPEWRKKV
jgi:phage shock protein B